MKKILIIAVIFFIAVAGVSVSVFKSFENSVTKSGEELKSQSGDIGQGREVFEITVVGIDGEETSFTVHTDEKTVGDALVRAGLVSGDKGPYGLYMKTVNGVTLEYEKDGKYWAFYVDGEYATRGVSETEIEEGVAYAIKAE